MARTLFKSDASCRLDTAYHMGGDYKYKNTHNKGNHIDKNYAPHGKIHWNTCQIIAFRIESNDTSQLLYEKQC